MKALAIVGSLALLSGCSTVSDFMFGEERQITAEQRLLIICEGWHSAFAKINDRDIYGMATDAEIKAVNAGLLVLNPVCTKDLVTADGFNIWAMEQVLVDVLTAKGDDT